MKLYWSYLDYGWKKHLISNGYIHRQGLFFLIVRVRKIEITPIIYCQFIIDDKMMNCTYLYYIAIGVVVVFKCDYGKNHNPILVFLL